MMLVGISGSPRKGGNTELLLDSFLEGALSRGEDCDKVILNDYNFSPCQECDQVNRDGTCRVEDEMKFIYQKINNADVIVIASPVFFGSVSAQVKMMVDRYQCFWMAKNVFHSGIYIKPKKGYFLCVAAHGKDSYFENSRSIVKNFFATIEAEYSGDIFCNGVEGKSDILSRKDCLDMAYRLGAGEASFHGA